jgi:diguanylate cyclase (GGDEF)-like protein
MPSTSSGWLLLLACLPIQRLAALGRVRMALAVACTASAGHLALAGPEAGPLSLLALPCFWAVIAAMLVEHRAAARRLEVLTELCDVDEATGCLNRRGFARHLERAAAAGARTGAPVALLALDLDHFKEVNDRFGHLSGDAVLSEVSASLRRIVAHDGVVARLGGEEFAILMPEADAEMAGVMAERTLATLRELRLEALPADVRLTMSAGIASERMDDARSSDALRARADEALYAAKRSGRDRALLWPPGVHSHATPIRASAAIRS